MRELEMGEGMGEKGPNASSADISKVDHEMAVDSLRIAACFVFEFLHVAVVPDTCAESYEREGSFICIDCPCWCVNVV